MRDYVLYGDEYFGDGVSGAVAIMRGTKEQCKTVLDCIEGDCQYTNMRICIEFGSFEEAQEAMFHNESI